MSIRLTSAEINDLCVRHCELGERLSDEEIDKLIDTAAAALDLEEELGARLGAAEPHTPDSKE